MGTTVGGSDIAKYTYDSSGNRLTKTVGITTTTYHYFHGQLWYETLNTDASNVIHALYLRSPNGQLQAVSLNYVVGGTNNTWYYYHYDAQGDVNVVTDSSGNVYRQYFYDPYGNVIKVLDGSGNTVDINNDSGFNNAYTYRGYRYDSESGLYFLNARYYAAGIGRFLTKDTSLGNPKNPDTLNRYAYAAGDPVNRIDPSGHWSIWGVLGAVAVAAVAVASLPADALAAVGAAIVTAVSTVASAISNLVESPAVNSIEDGAGESTASKVTQEPIHVTEDVIKNAMKDAPLKTQQGSVSQPVIQRYVDRLQSGEEAPPIKVDEGIIVDGNHRYIPGRIVGEEPNQIPWSGGRPDRVIDWNDLQIDHFDWGNK